MLVIQRKVNESIQIGDGIYVTVTRINPKCVRLGITANEDLNVRRIDRYLTPKERHSNKLKHNGKPIP